METTATPSDLSGRRILVVEDEYFLADDLRRVLAQSGAEVVGPVPTRADALDLLAREPRIDLAVLDINLQGELAWPVADALAERAVPFLFATGYDSDSIPERHGQIPRWQKPFTLAALLRALPDLSAGH